MQLTKKQQKEQKKAQEIVDQFNEKYPVGSTVMHRKSTSNLHEFEPRTVERAAYISSSLDPVAFFEELSGYYLVTPSFVQY